jgi:hypothetical protein
MIFESNGVATDLYAVSEEVVRTLPSELSDPYTPDRPWTKAVKARLHDMGKEGRFLVCCHGAQDQGEWLLDLVWMVWEEHNIVLAVESEWGNLPQVEDDFDKLMSIKSRRKLMLFSTRNHTGAGDIVKRLESNMQAYP